MMHDVKYSNMDLKCADTLDSDWPFTENNGIQLPLKFDSVVANPPYSQKWDTKTIDLEKDTLFKEFGVAPASKADYAFILHGLYHLDEKGTMAIVLPHGVLFIDASSDFTKGKNQNKLMPENINKIIDTYTNREDIEKYAHVASLEEIIENDYNLNIPRYVDTFEEEEVKPLSEIGQDLRTIRQEVSQSTDELFRLLSELEGTNNEAKEELAKFIELLK